MKRRKEAKRRESKFEGIKELPVEEVKPRKPEKILFSCDNCDYTTTKTSRMERHQKREKRKVDKKKVRGERTIVKKEKIKKAFGDENMKGESGPRLYFCKECKYSTKNSFNLKRHEDNVHKGLLQWLTVDACVHFFVIL